MIIWLNGAFGAGKTSSAFELHRRLPDSFVYDPENVGYLIWKNSPKNVRKSDFQDHEQWRSFNFELLRTLSREYAGTLIVPMTLVNRQYYDELVQRLMDEGVEVRHFILYADKSVIFKRLNKRRRFGETWAKAQADRCIDAFDHRITEEKIHTDRMNVDQVVEEIAARCGLTLPPDRRGRIRKFFDRTMTLIRHIR